MHVKYFILTMALFITGGWMNCNTIGNPQPPKAQKISHYDTTHGDIRLDNYYWLRNRGNQEVLDYLTAENEYTEKMMASTADLRETLFQEMKGRLKEDDQTAPVKIDNYYYYSRMQKGKQYPVYCRKKGNLSAEEEIILDQNKLAAGKKFLSLGAFAISPNHQYLAYSTDSTGREIYTITIKDLNTGKILPERIPNTYYSLEWGNDNQTIFYTTLDNALRPYKLFRHRVGTPHDRDVMVYHEKDEKFFLSISKTRSRKYLLLQLNSQVTSEIHFLDADTPQGKFKIFRPREYNVEYSLEHHGKYFYITINKNAVNFKIMRTSVNHIQERYWKTFMAHDPQIMINGVDAFQNFLVITRRVNGLRQLHVVPLKNGSPYDIEFGEATYTIGLSSNPEFKTDIVRLTYQSLITPKTVYDFNLKTKEKKVLKKQEIPGGYNAENYESMRLYVRASDGTRIPVSMVYRKGIQRTGNNPFYLYGYGSYGNTIEPRFSTSRLSLLDRGFIYAIAHIRGGGAMGRSWYENGKLLKKKNTFTDFISVAEYMIQEKYTNNEHLVIAGGSAGGLLMGAVTNMRPDLFKAVIAHVPFVDVVNTMLDPSIPLTVIEYDEWGNPNEKKYYDYIKSYSPYDNVEAKKYPNILITAGLNDPRVQYWEPAKWTAKLRDLKTDDNIILLKTNMGAGHMGASGRYDYLKEIAFDYAFAMKMLGLAGE